MPITKEEFKTLIAEKIKTTVLEVEDISGGCGTMFEVFIVSPEFENKSLLERQKFVNAQIEGVMKQIHALTYKKTLTPEQYEKYKLTQQQAQQK